MRICLHPERKFSLWLNKGCWCRMPGIDEQTWCIGPCFWEADYNLCLLLLPFSFLLFLLISFSQKRAFCWFCKVWSREDRQKWEIFIVIEPKWTFGHRLRQLLMPARILFPCKVCLWQVAEDPSWGLSCMTLIWSRGQKWEH